jgi:hypothetical protein
MLRLYVQILGISGVAVGVLSALEQGVRKPSGAGFGEAAAEDGDEILASEGLRHEFPSLAGPGIAGEGSFHQRRRVEFGFHGLHQVFGGVLGAAQARLFFFNFADFAVDLLARGFGKGVEKFLEAFGLAEFAGEDGMDGHGEGKTLPRMRGMARIFTELAQAARSVGGLIIID